VTVDGLALLRPASRVRIGAHVTIAIPASAPRRLRPEAEAADLDVLYEDEWLLALNKPPGVVVHPSYKQTSGTLLNGVLWRLRLRAGATPGIITRLDKDTSGLVLIALAPAIHATVQRDGAAGHVWKRYLALVDGVPSPSSGRIMRPIGREPGDRRRMMVSPGGAPSETTYDVMHTIEAGNRRRALVACTPVTGRTHQIRVHLASLGCPVLGDRVYGAADEGISRQALHAWAIALPHPVTQEPLVIEAPLPSDMESVLRAHGTMPPSLTGWLADRRAPRDGPEPESSL
jgi:23S rRNA pseudouridine1911/1915/1917 synthase